LRIASLPHHRLFATLDCGSTRCASFLPPAAAFTHFTAVAVDRSSPDALIPHFHGWLPIFRSPHVSRAPERSQLTSPRSCHAACWTRIGFVLTSGTPLDHVCATTRVRFLIRGWVLFFAHATLRCRDASELIFFLPRSAIFAFLWTFSSGYWTSPTRRLTLHMCRCLCLCKLDAPRTSCHWPPFSDPRLHRFTLCSCPRCPFPLPVLSPFCTLTHIHLASRTTPPWLPRTHCTHTCHSLLDRSCVHFVPHTSSLVPFTHTRSCTPLSTDTSRLHSHFA